MGIKLVIVDDAPFIREAVRSLLMKNEEIEIVAEACDGEEAVSVVSKLKPDVVLMDMVLPKKNGLEAAKEILGLYPKIKVVACSTEGQESLILQALDAGCCNFLSKPFGAEELIKTIRAAGGKLSG